MKPLDDGQGLCGSSVGELLSDGGVTIEEPRKRGVWWKVAQPRPLDIVLDDEPSTYHTVIEGQLIHPSVGQEMVYGGTLVGVGAGYEECSRSLCRIPKGNHAFEVTEYQAGPESDLVESRRDAKMPGKKARCP